MRSLRKRQSCMADGKSHQEALAALELVIAEWVETARELGRSVPEPRGRLMFAQHSAAADRLWKPQLVHACVAAGG